MKKKLRIITSSGTLLIGLLLIFIPEMNPFSRDHQIKAEPFTYLALGDSYTIGEKVDAAESFPVQVVTLLNGKGFNFRKPAIIAQTGWTTDDLLEAMKTAKLDRQYSFVSLLIGVNNQYRGRKVQDYVPEFEIILKQALQLAGSNSDHVIVLSIPDWGVTPFAEGRDRKQIASEIDKYNAANKVVAEKYKVHYINITTGTREAAGDSSLLAMDGLHPSAKEYERWAERVANYIQTKL